MEKQKLPEWYKKEPEKEGSTVRNPLNGEEFPLNNIELTLYDIIQGSVAFMQMGMADDLSKDAKRSLEWFKDNNHDAHLFIKEIVDSY